MEAYIANIANIASAWPLVLLVFAIVTISVIVGLSAVGNKRNVVRGRVMALISSMFGVALSIFTTPFHFLQRSIDVIIDAQSSDDKLRGGRQYTLKRFSNILYLGVMITVIIILSLGFTSALISLYPAAEIESDKRLSASISRFESELIAAQSELTAASSSASEWKRRREQLIAQTASDCNRAQQELESFGTNGYSGGILADLQASENVTQFNGLWASIGEFYSTCPADQSKFPGFADWQCRELESLSRRYASLKAARLNACAAAQAANSSENSAEEARVAAANRVATLTSNLSSERELYNDTRVSNGSWIIPHLIAGVALIVSTIIAVLAFVWSCAIGLDVISWLIAVMKKIETWTEL